MDVLDRLQPQPLNVNEVNYFVLKLCCVYVEGARIAVLDAHLTD